MINRPGEPCYKCGNNEREIHSYCRECYREIRKVKYAVNRDRVLEINRLSRSKDPEKSRLRARQRNRELREAVIRGYGGRCTCCGISVYEFLTIDHVLNDGNVERKQVCRDAMLRKIIRDQFPDRYTVLCYNCNLAKAFHGGCPHKSLNAAGACSILRCPVILSC